MLQDFNEPDLSTTPIPQPDLSTLTWVERTVLASYIRRRYYKLGTKYPLKMKRDIFYNGMKWVLRRYSSYIIGIPFLVMVTLSIILSISFLVFIPISKPLSHLLYISFVAASVPTWILGGAVTPVLASSYRIQNRYRDANGIPRDRRSKQEKLVTPERYC